ncbi:cell adhesion molecule Dscam2-like [Diorhabda sublineata]|uniref:cell adhesion molecule Dscam2-like n=1 Tax=Diorhabda sublineata TaxID=1163346 RepID=UPI0024E09E15|nr:cell adhesion molecule Dscam2-like [Diorhabda sublineata]
MCKIWFFILITVYCDCLAQTDNSTTNIKSQNIEESNSSQNASDESVNLENGTNVAVPPKITSVDRTFTTTYKEDVTLPCRYTGSPIPVVTWTINHVKFSRDAASRIKQLPNGSLLIRDPTSTDTGEYSCQVRNDFGQDVKTYRLVVKTPPKAPSVQLVSTTNNSLTINIKPSDNEEEPILGYSVHYKEEFGEWETIQIADEKKFTIDNLICGSRYRLYVNAFNNIGQGEPSDTILLKIKGTKPIIPKIDKFIVVLSTSAVLHLRAFPDGDCSLLYFVIELKKKIDTEWNQINNRTQPGGKLVIQGLDPGYWYQLRVTAHNSAGFSVGEYEFATLFVRPSNN